MRIAVRLTFQLAHLDCTINGSGKAKIWPIRGHFECFGDACFLDLATSLVAVTEHGTRAMQTLMLLT